MGPGTGKGRSEGDGLATAVQIAQLQVTLDNLAKANSIQHADMTERLFGQTATSLQSQITAIHESAFSDNPTSLRSRIGTIEQNRAAISNRVWGAWLVITSLIGILGFKSRDIALWLAKALGYHP